MLTTRKFIERSIQIQCDINSYSTVVRRNYHSWIFNHLFHCWESDVSKYSSLMVKCIFRCVKSDKSTMPKRQRGSDTIHLYLNPKMLKCFWKFRFYQSWIFSHNNVVFFVTVNANDKIPVAIRISGLFYILSHLHKCPVTYGRGMV